MFDSNKIRLYLCNLLIKLEEKVAREVVLRKPVGKP